jgi:SAM-dependent methyltransferase
VDAEAYRQESRDRWARAAEGWERRAEELQRDTLPVSRWLVDAIRPQPGHRVLDLAAGPGETGFLAAELIRPGGLLISSDQSAEMVEAARRRAAARGLDDGVEFRELHAEALDLPAGNLDGVVCRWGYMLMADPAAALQETRRVLRPGGRLALAVWDDPQANPWAAIPQRTLVDLGATEPPPPGSPGMFALADRDRLRASLDDAGFLDVEVGTVEFDYRSPSLDDWWAGLLDLSRPIADAVERMAEPYVAKLREELARRLEPYTQPDGSLVLPARTLVAAASA